MIARSELMIGNLVTDEFYENFKTIIKVDSINERGINLTIQDDSNYPECPERWIDPEYTWDTLFGIPMSEEWFIERFGFNRDGRLHPTYRLGMIIVEKALLEDGVYFVRKAISSTTSVILKRIRFVHELQNVYYHNNDSNKSLTVIR